MPHVDSLSQMRGPGASGKSTLVKCIRKAMADRRDQPETFGGKEKAEVYGEMQKNVIESIQKLCRYARKNLPEESAPSTDGLNDEEKAAKGEAANAFKEKVDQVLSVENWQRITTKQADLIAELWAEKAIEEAWAKRHSYQINSNTDYFLSKVREIVRDGYVVTDSDILQVRAETKAGTIYTVDLESEELIASIVNCFNCCACKKVVQTRALKILDAGGQEYHQQANEANETWRYYKHNATIIFFVVPLGDIAQESGTTGTTDVKTGAALTESLLLLDTLLGEESNKNTKFVVCLNKFDLFVSAMADKGKGKEIIRKWLLSAVDVARENNQRPELAKLFAELAGRRSSEGEGASLLDAIPDRDSDLVTFFDERVVRGVVKLNQYKDMESIRKVRSNGDGNIDRY